MWYLNKSTQSLKAITLEAVTTALDFVVVFHLRSGRLNIGPQTEIGTINNVLSTIVPSPAADEQADVKNIIVTNTDNVNHNLVFYFSEGTDKQIFKCLLEPDWFVIWEEESGWCVYNENGAPITLVQFIDVSTATGVLSPVHGGTGVANNAANTITFTGNFSLGLTLTGNTTLTLPSTGTVATLSGAEAFTNKTSYNGLVITANTGIITSGGYQATSISTTYTDAKIKGAVAATTGLIAYGNGTADTVTTSSGLSYISTVLSAELITASNAGTGGIRLRGYTSDSTHSTIYMRQSTPSGTNYTLYTNGTTVTHLNAPTTLNLCAGGTTILAITSSALTFSNAVNMVFNTSTGTKIGTGTTQKISLWNATPDVQPTNAIAAAAFVANSSGIADDTATWGGYTGGQIVAALKRLGALA